jgi:hypothetical protein
MAMVISIPSSVEPRIGPGCTLTITGMTSAAPGHKLAVAVTNPAGSGVLTFGGVVLGSSSDQADVVLGILAPGYTTYSGPYYAGQSGLLDNSAVNVALLHYSAGFSLLESAAPTGRLWDATGWLSSLLHYSIADNSAILDQIFASVRRTFITP